MNAVNTFEVPVTCQAHDENDSPTTLSCTPVEPNYTIGCKDHRISVSDGDDLVGEAQDTYELRSLVQSLGVTHQDQVSFDESIDLAKGYGFDSGFEVFQTVMEALAEKADIADSSSELDSKETSNRTRFTELGWKTFIEEQKGFFGERITLFIDAHGASRGFSSFDGEVDMLHFKYNLPSYVDEYSNELSSAVTKLFDVMGEKLEQSDWTFFVDSIDSQSKQRSRVGKWKRSSFQYAVAMVFFHTLATLLRPSDRRMSLSAKAIVQELIFSFWTYSEHSKISKDYAREIISCCGIKIEENLRVSSKS